LVAASESTALLPAVAELEATLLPHPWGQDSLGSTLAQAGTLLAVAEDPSSRLLSYCVIQQICDEATVLQVGTARAAQGQGLASRLLQQCIEQLSTTGCVTLWLEVRAGNAAAIGLYQRLGFVTETVRKRYYPPLLPGAPDEDAWVMRYNFSPA
jgi:ribosomal-protein-alanine N-acetyltransferase